MELACTDFGLIHIGVYTTCAVALHLLMPVPSTRRTETSASTIEILLTITILSAACALLSADLSSNQVIYTIEILCRDYLCFMSYIYTTPITNPCHYLECSLRQAARRIPRINPIIVLLLHLRQRASRARSSLPTTSTVFIAVRSASSLRNSRDASERARDRSVQSVWSSCNATPGIALGTLRRRHGRATDLRV